MNDILAVLSRALLSAFVDLLRINRNFVANAYGSIPCLIVGLTISLTAKPASAATPIEQSSASVVVTYYTDQASFLAAISPYATLNFEGLATDTGFRLFGSAYHPGSVTFTSPVNTLPVSYRDILVVGKNSQTLGRPFDSALLIPSSTPSSLVATFDPGSNVTAVGGHFLDLFGDSSSVGSFTLMGTSGILDQRTVPVGIAKAGLPKTFFGYTVTGDTIVSLSQVSGTNAPAFDNFVYGTVIPEPAFAQVALVFLGLVLSLGAARRFRSNGIINPDIQSAVHQTM